MYLVIYYTWPTFAIMYFLWITLLTFDALIEKLLMGMQFYRSFKKILRSHYNAVLSSCYTEIKIQQNLTGCPVLSNNLGSRNNSVFHRYLQNWMLSEWYMETLLLYLNTLICAYEIITVASSSSLQPHFKFQLGIKLKLRLKWVLLSLLSYLEEDGS